MAERALDEKLSLPAVGNETFREGARWERARIRREMFAAIGEVRQATTMASNPFEVAMQIEDRLEEATRDD